MLKLVLAAIALFVLWEFFTGWAESGPNCPGMDPSWIGWCNRGGLSQP